jgi:Grx4 family monothiol glutaredoxin
VSVVPTFLFLNSDGSIVDRIDGGEDVAAVARGYSKLLRTSSAASHPPYSAPSSSESTEDDKRWKVELSEAASPPSTVEEKLKLLLNRQRVMLFMKGVPSAPRCGFSRQIVEILDSHNATYGAFDILQDEEVRQGLKEYSDWPTYPQLYVDGELVGGLDIVKEMVEDGELEGLLKDRSSESSIRRHPNDDVVVVNASEEEKKEAPTIDEKLELLLNRQRVMLFMKGVPSAPRCGFSRQIVEILDSHNATYESFDILQDEEVRQGLKEYSDWPTYPQLYVDGELVGGLDIVKEMVEDGELERLLRG